MDIPHASRRLSPFPHIARILRLQLQVDQRDTQRPATMPFSLVPKFPPNTSPRLRTLQTLQLGTVALSLLATLLTPLIPHAHKRFTLGLLYPLLLTSASTTFLVFREVRRAREGTLTKGRYAKYAVLKLCAAFGLSIVGFVLDAATSDGKCDVKRRGETGLWIRCVKVGRWQGAILWLGVFNW